MKDVVDLGAMDDEERKAQLWERADEFHNLVNRISAEQARLASVGGPAPRIDLLSAREKLIEEADKVLEELAALYRQS